MAQSVAVASLAVRRLPAGARRDAMNQVCAST